MLALYSIWFSLDLHRQMRLHRHQLLINISHNFYEILDYNENYWNSFGPALSFLYNLLNFLLKIIERQRL